MLRLVLLAALSNLACGDNTAAPTCEDRGPLSGLRSAVQAQDRYILGAGGAYPANAMLRGEERELYRSQMHRREAAWQTVQKILAPVAIAQELPNSPGQEVSLWQTWYAKDDTTRVFQSLFSALSSDEQSARARFTQESIDEALGWNATELDELAAWSQERREDYFGNIDSRETLAGVAGAGLVSYSPSALRNLLRSYPELLACQQAGVPSAIVEPPGEIVQQALREPVRVATCGQRHLGPFYLAEGEELSVAFTGTGGTDATITIQDDSANVETCNGDEICQYRGTGAVHIDLSAGTTALEGTISVDYASPDAPWAACLEGAFANDSVVVKASWSRAQFGIELPVYDTSADSLRTILSDNANSGWGLASHSADPSPDDIHTLELPNGNRYRLTGLHIMSKELEHWQWTTLWWSDTPDSDFGEDRPGGITALGGPWSNYKMCTVTMFDEGDSDPSGGYSETAPGLAAALAAVHGGAGAPSWCSNPYIEVGAGNMGTNCIGCHQHGGTELLSETIIGDAEGFPDFGRTQLRNNFPHDYSWAPTAGDEIALAFKSVVDFFD